MNSKEIELKGINVIFAELEDKGFGLSITIDATDKAVQDAISKWVKDNGINGGEAKFKEYKGKDDKTTVQYQFKFSKYTEVQYKDEAVAAMGLGYGAVINLIAQAYDYDNKFGKGTSALLKAVYVKQGRKSTIMDRIAD